MNRIEYDVSARGYLNRARSLLAQGGEANKFYAAFELRAGLERRISEHLGEWDHVPNRAKRSWKIGDLDQAARKAFHNHAHVADLTFSAGESRVRFLYTPVRSEGRKAAETLNQYLHAQKANRSLDQKWWLSFRDALQLAEEELRFAVTGTLLGPAMLGKTNQVQMMSEIVGDAPPAVLADGRQSMRCDSRLSSGNRLRNP